MDEFSVLCSSQVEIESLIRSLIDYELIITSAMHIEIVCHSYGIPCLLVNFEDAADTIHGDGIKYDDYYTGAGLAPKNRLMLSNNLTNVDFEGHLRPDRVAQEKIDQVHSNILGAIELFDDRMRKRRASPVGSGDLPQQRPYQQPSLQGCPPHLERDAAGMDN
jgi:hypothetical protein